MHTTHFGTDTISSLGPKLWKLIPDKIKHTSILSAFKAKIKSSKLNICPCRLCKICKILVLLKLFRVSNGINTSAYSFFLKGGENFLKENLEHLHFLPSWTYNLQKNIYNSKYHKFKKVFTYLVLYRIRGVF